MKKSGRVFIVGFSLIHYLISALVLSFAVQGAVDFAAFLRITEGTTPTGVAFFVSSIVTAVGFAVLNLVWVTLLWMRRPSYGFFFYLSFAAALVGICCSMVLSLSLFNTDPQAFVVYGALAAVIGLVGVVSAGVVSGSGVFHSWVLPDSA